MTIRDLCSTLIVHSHNIHLLHWKVRGDDFVCTHRFMDEIREEIEKSVDIVAEMCMQYGVNPPSLQEALTELDNLDTEVVMVKSDAYYTSKEVYTDAAEILDGIVSALQSTIKDTDNNLISGHISDLDSIMSAMAKFRFLCQSSLVNKT